MSNPPITNTEFMSRLIDTMEHDAQHGIKGQDTLPPSMSSGTPEEVQAHIRDYFISTDFLRRAVLSPDFSVITNSIEFQALDNFYALCHGLVVPEARIDFSMLRIILHIAVSLSLESE